MPADGFATNVRGKNSIDRKHVSPLRKRLILNLDQLGITLDNIEGMTFSPDYADGLIRFRLSSGAVSVFPRGAWEQANCRKMALDHQLIMIIIYT